MESLAHWVAAWLEPAFTMWGSPVSRTELLACVLSVAMVLCNMRVNPWGWPLAIISSVLYAMLFVHAGLYGESGLQIFFAVISLWGWWQWLRGRTPQGAALMVHRLSRRQMAATATATLLAWPLLGWVLQHNTDSTVPYLDALPTVGSVAGQFLLGRKLIENWPVWVMVNVFSLGLFAYKGLWLTTALYVVFAVLAVAGWREWVKLEGHVRA
jgi:nicotinamide mononucleotide transporter